MEISILFPADIDKYLFSCVIFYIYIKPTFPNEEKFLDWDVNPQTNNTLELVNCLMLISDNNLSLFIHVGYIAHPRDSYKQ